jgi:hypothetical protein
MKTTNLLATLIAAALPLSSIPAQEAAQTGTTEPKQEESSGVTGRTGKMMCDWTDRDAELNKLVGAMNSSPPEKKLDAVAAVLTLLVEQRNATHLQMQKMMSTKEGMGMCCMMMGMDEKGNHSAHH